MGESNMNRPAQIISILIFSVSVSVFAGCGKQETTDTSTNGTIPTTSETVVKEETDQPAALQNLDEIKWNDVKDPLIEDAMIATLKAAIAAFVSKDLDQFHAALGPDVGTGHDYLFDHPVKFTGIAEAMKENNRILIPIVGERLKNEEGYSPDIRYTFYLEKDKDGAWKIVSID
jgi:hypothetical protein